jgi:hypothetical protein
MTPNLAHNERLNRFECAGIGATFIAALRTAGWLSLAAGQWVGVGIGMAEGCFYRMHAVPLSCCRFVEQYLGRPLMGPLHSHAEGKSAQYINNFHCKFQLGLGVYSKGPALP